MSDVAGKAANNHFCCSGVLISQTRCNPNKWIKLALETFHIKHQYYSIERITLSQIRLMLGPVMMPFQEKCQRTS
jgi:hypothetical protein